jgi:periplasmic divalent cation tolerance protein
MLTGRFWGSKNKERLLRYSLKILNAMSFLVFYVPCPDEAAAQRMAAHFVEKRLAACANIFPIQSLYEWEGAVQREGEWVAILKTSLALEKILEAEIEKTHPYDLPCILRFEVRANAAYERWVEESTGG